MQGKNSFTGREREADTAVRCWVRYGQQVSTYADAYSDGNAAAVTHSFPVSSAGSLPPSLWSSFTCFVFRPKT